ncbi:MAG: adenylate/guanylate cyclase domain-containing protein [Gammaproteobacteria bacterium]|nr:adenylate/guanylate cyclase domain-containing protein [Gammaproteobacteria bacterium]
MTPLHLYSTLLNSGKTDKPSSARFPIAYKLALVFTLLITAGMVLLGLFIVQDQNRLLEQQMHDFGTTITEQLAKNVKEHLLSGDKLSLATTAKHLVNHSSILGVAIYSDEGKPETREGATLDEIVLATTNNSVTKLNWRSSVEEGAPPTELVSFFTPLVTRNVTVGYALVTFDRSFMNSAQLKTLNTVIGATILLVLLGIIISILLGRRLAQPIAKLTEASKSISEGNYSFRFTEKRRDELGTLMLAMNAMTEDLAKKEKAESTLSRYISPKIAKEVLDEMEPAKLGGAKVYASVVFADIVGFTRMSEHMQPEEVNSMLNEYFNYITKAAHAYSGHVDKFMGDCAMLVFGVPGHDEQHCFHAVACAVLIQKFFETLNQSRDKQGLTPVQFSIGINSGEMLAGNMGSIDRMDYTVIGDTVNTASKLCSAAEPGEILIPENIAHSEQLQKYIISTHHKTIILPGKENPVVTHRVTDIV